MKKTFFPPSLKFISRLMPNPQSRNEFFSRSPLTQLNNFECCSHKSRMRNSVFGLQSIYYLINNRYMSFGISYRIAWKLSTSNDL